METTKAVLPGIAYAEDVYACAAGADALVLAMPGGTKETLSRSAIKDMKSLDRTLMPDGLEAAITKDQMSDLLAFLLGK